MMTVKTAPERDSLADQLAQRIRAKLQSSEYSDGDVFMTETQLATEFEASRTIVREAVSRLRALGILEGRQGKGLVVRRPDLIRLVSESVPSLAGIGKDRRELIELRYVLEVGGIELAVRNATEHQIEELSEFARQFSESAGHRELVNQHLQLDLQFHTLLLAMTNSPLVSGLNEVLAGFFAVNPAENSCDDEAVYSQLHAEAARQHFELVSAIRDRDIERARYVMRSHIACYLHDGASPNESA